MSVTGLTITRSKDYSPCLEKPVRFTMATVEPCNKANDDKEGWTSIYITINANSETEQTMLLASLHNGKGPNQTLDFMVTPMDKLKICIEGASSRAFLTGHWIVDEDDSEFDDSELDSEYSSGDEEEEGMISRVLNGEEDEDEDDDEEDDERVVELMNGAAEDSEEEEEEETPKRKLSGAKAPSTKRVKEEAPAQKEKTPKKEAKKEKETPKKEAKKEKETPKKEAKKEKETPKKDAKKEKETPSKSNKRVINGGVVVQDFVAGDGKKATKGKRVTVYYEGRLNNGKVFDSCKVGKGFSFRLGGGEVIKGWDVGVEGMTIGGKRRLTCPPSFAYGKQGAPPDIPKNATLTFDVQLLSVK